MRTWTLPKEQSKRIENEKPARFQFCEFKNGKLHPITDHAYTFQTAVWVFQERACALSAMGLGWALREVKD